MWVGQHTTVELARLPAALEQRVVALHAVAPADRVIRSLNLRLDGVRRPKDRRTRLSRVEVEAREREVAPEREREFELLDRLAHAANRAEALAERVVEVLERRVAAQRRLVG